MTTRVAVLSLNDDNKGLEIKLNKIVDFKTILCLEIKD